MYVIYENPIVNCAVDEIIDFGDFCSDIFGAAQAEKSIRQIYRAYGIAHDLYKEVEREYEAHEFDRRRKAYRRRKEYNRKSKVYILPITAGSPSIGCRHKSMYAMYAMS